jgi:Cytidylate kinase-like family
MPRTKNEQVRGIEAKAAELQARFHDLLERAYAEARDAAEHPVEPALGPYVTMTRQAASGGVDVARLAAKRLGWALLGRELVEATAERLRVSPRMLSLMDETGSNWFSESMITLLEPRLTIQDSYVSLVTKVILLAAHEGNAVFVGRGATFILPRAFGLSVRVIAPLAARIARLAEREGLDARTAGRRIEEIEDSRRHFVRRHFRRDVEEPSHYDLVLDSEALGVEGCADLLCRALELRGLPQRHR